MIDIKIDATSEVIAAAVEVYESTGSVLQAVDSAKSFFDGHLEIAIMEALAAIMGGESQ